MKPTPNIAIVGATGAVGRECLAILEERAFPHASLRLFASARSAGAAIPFRGREHRVEELGERSFEGIDLAFFAAGADTARSFAPRAVAAGATVIDKSSAYRADPDIPLVIPEINPEELAPLRSRPGIVAVPNCSTIVMLLPVEPLRRAFGVARLIVSTYQAASGAGAAAMRELEEQTRDVLAGRSPQPRVFREPCAFNVFSHDSTVDPATGSNGEEAKMAAETRRIWNDPAVRITATCVRVGVLRGHSESIHLTLKTPATERQVRDALADGPALRVVDDRGANRFPTPLKATGENNVLVGRIRPDDTPGPATGYSLFVSGDQLRIGAALTAVKIAEGLIR
jgi:aspartate-semialdehyde dehydrogenase